MFGLSCSSGFGNKLASDQLDIYFEGKNLESYADSLGSYWTKNKLVGDRKQSIKLTQSVGKIEVRLIQSKEFESEALAPEELALLLDLKKDLKINVFKGKSIELFICDNEFKPKFKVE